MNALQPNATFARRPIPAIVQQHVEEAAHLRHVRSILVRAPHVRLLQLGRIDERIAAHLDGIAVAGEFGAQLCHEALDPPGAGTVFAAAARAIDAQDLPRLADLMAVAEPVPCSRRGLLSAFGWVSASSLRGITHALLAAPDPWRREIGLASCAMHGVDPGAALDAAMRDPDPALRARGCRVAGEGGRSDLLPHCFAAIGSGHAALAFHAARAALLLGERNESVAALQAIAVHRVPVGRGVPAEGEPAFAQEALGLLLKVLPLDRARALLQHTASDPARLRLLVWGVGIAGDPQAAPWLIAQMESLPIARLAGEAFSRITGCDLAALDLERPPPEGVEFGPNDDPEDENVAMDEDDGLPWPDPERVSAWWRAHGPGFVAGRRSFCGEAPSPAHALRVLREGTQRHRREAAQYLCLQTPGTALFNIAAPAWRQKRLLAAMEAR